MKTLLTLKQNFRYLLLIMPTISQASVNEDDECAKSNAVAAFLEDQYSGYKVKCIKTLIEIYWELGVRKDIIACFIRVGQKTQNM